METYKLLSLKDYPFKTFDKIRYRDTDRQGHVNNAVFSTFIETGRLEMMYHPDRNLADDDCFFVIIRIEMEMVAEVTWPGRVEIGTGVTRIGNSSIGFAQGIYQEDRLVAVATSVIVQMDGHTRKSRPLSDRAKESLKAFFLTINEK
ncbi:MAG: acyl-CoA thioesterase [Acholeplasmataceae bacterium]|nr:MAG: acyl-CoA thioesterase [Acholeplasmataceae bacterium]